MSELVRLGETEQFAEYAKELARREKACPDCGNDPDDDSLHRIDCRRIFPAGHELEYLQDGPPWQPWPDSDARPEEER